MHSIGKTSTVPAVGNPVCNRHKRRSATYPWPGTLYPAETVSGRIKCSHLWAEWSQPGLMWIHNPQKPYDSQVDALFVAAVFRRLGAADAGSDPVGGMAAFASGRVVDLTCSEMPEVCPAPSPDSPADRFRKR